MKAARATSAPASLPAPAVRLVILGLPLTALALFLGWGVAPVGLPITLVILYVGLALAIRGMALHYPHDRLGACNIVTATRLAMASGLAASLAGTATANWAVFALALSILLLDGVDGWLARRQRLSSELGARFDMEVDSALAAILALSLLAQGRAGPELIVLGGARYAFVAAASLMPWLAAPLYHSLRRKAVCVFQIGVLAALAAPVLPEAAARPLAWGAAVAVTWSFCRDIRWLGERR